MANSKEFIENKSQGYLAEDILEFILNSMEEQGWKFVGYGIEQHTETLKNSLRQIYSPLSQKIRSMPDAIAINEKTKEVILFECKYKSYVERKHQTEAINLVEDEYGKVIDFDVIDYRTATYIFDKGIIKRYKQYWPETILFIVQPYGVCFFTINISQIKDYMLIEEYEHNNKTLERWDFHEIEIPLTQLIQDIPKEIIEKAKKKIPCEIRCSENSK